MNTTTPTPSAIAAPAGPELTERQQQILAMICRYWAVECRPPTVREIAAATGISSPNGVLCHLKALRKKGAIELASRETARGIWPAGLKDRIRAAMTV